MLLNLNIELIFYIFLFIGILSLFTWSTYKYDLCKEKVIWFFLSRLLFGLSNPLVWLVSYFFINWLSIKISCYDISYLFDQFLHDLFPDHLMMEQYPDDGVKSLPMPGVKCPRCLEERNDTVWVLQGKNCPKCNYPC